MKYNREIAIFFGECAWVVFDKTHDIFTQGNSPYHACQMFLECFILHHEWSGRNFLEQVGKTPSEYNKYFLLGKKVSINSLPKDSTDKDAIYTVSVSFDL